jgi:SecD/SecF fusion protein
MKQFFWKIVICLTPCLLAGWVTTEATVKYLNGESGGFKFGVDLVGGTILVYEIDTRKQAEQGGKIDLDTNLLAASLKRRIDPNDLYNITIRPAGGEGRVEIILPTGGVYRAQKAEKAWAELLKEMEDKYFSGMKDAPHLEVGRGKVLELAERIQMTLAERIWSQELFGSKKAWSEFLDRFWIKAQDQWESLFDQVDPLTPTSTVGSLAAARPLQGAAAWTMNSAARSFRKKLDRLSPGDLKGFSLMLQRELGSGSSEKGIEAWIKGQAWDQLLVRVRGLWPDLKGLLLSQEMERLPLARRTFGAVYILPDSIEQLVGFIQTGGSLIGESALASVDAILGNDALSDVTLANEAQAFIQKHKSTGGPDAKAVTKFIQDKKGKVDAQIIALFIERNYGPSLAVINKDIQDLYNPGGRGKDLTLEEVQRIKDLVAKVGSLEFRILANSTDDEKAIKDAQNMLNVEAAGDPALQQELKDAQERGLPPPGPRVPGRKDPQEYLLTKLAHNQKSLVTYSWVELGPQERYSLNLDNAAEFDLKRSVFWQEAKKSRGRATQLKEPNSNRLLLQGALFYSRKCEDRNMPEEERRQKAVEYFVLTRDPEINTDLPTSLPLEKRRTSKIDGSYLSGARADIRDVRPSVSFSFNKAGAELFGTLTRKNIPTGSGSEESQTKRHLAIVLDGLIMSAPTINSEIRDAGQITGTFTKREVDDLVNILRAGALPASLKPQPVSESTLGATLGQDTIESGVFAIGWAFVVVLIFMLVYYRFAGLVASVALLANLLLTIGFMVFVQATFTLPGLAGLVLMLGMAVDANVLIYERLREEHERGAKLSLAIRNGYERALPTIIDTHLTGIFTAIVLYVVGNDQLKGFGVSLTVGLIISLFTSLYMTRLMFDFWLAKNWLHKLSMFKLFSRPDIDFMGVRYVFFTLTLVLSILGIGVFIGRLPNDLNIDFVGGTAYGAKLIQASNIQDFRDRLAEDKQKEWLRAEVHEEKGSNGTRFEIIYTNPDGSKTPPRSVLLANKIDAPTEKEREEIFAKRAGKLDDISIEQLFPSFDPQPEPDKSRYFTVRTSEKEPELVQAGLDRLLRNEQTGEALLARIFLRAEPLGPTGTRIHFYEKEPAKGFDPVADLRKKEKDQQPPAYASPSFVKTLLTRELVKAFDKKEKDDLTFQFDLLGEGKSQEGRFRVLHLKFSEPLKGQQLANVQKALERTQQAFEFQPQPERLEVFDPVLASETRFRAMWAILASWAGIALYLWFRFGSWTFGLAAVLCLIHDLFFTMGIVAACYYIHGTWLGNALLLEDFKIDLPAVAALLTLVGYSVNDTIVVFDRIREVRGKNPDLTPQMINDSVNQTLSRTLLTSFITWLVVMVLYVFGGHGVHLFGFVMVVGVLVGTYSSIYIASPLLLILGEGVKEAPRGRAPQPRAEPAPA